MTIREIIELAIAIAMIAGAVFLYRKRGEDGQRDTQGSVFLLLIGIIVALHALGAFSYRPSQSEIDAGRGAPVMTR